MRYLKSNTVDRILQITLLVGIANLIHSYRIWFDNDFVPRFPLYDAFSVPEFVSVTMWVALIALSVWGLITLDKRALIGLFAFSVLATLTDWNKAQPFFYHYFLFGLIWIMMDTRRTVMPFIIGIAGIYLWSGIHKMNPNYYNDLVYTVNLNVDPDWLKLVMVSTGKIIPWIEIILAPLLIWRLTSKMASYLSIGMHFSVLVFLALINSNYSIWIWNVGFILLHVALVYDTSSRDFNIRVPTQIAIAFFVLFPVANILTNRFAYQSWNLYSGRVPSASMYIEDPCNLKMFANDAQPKDHYQVNMAFDSKRHTGIAMNPEPWMMREWHRQICKDCNATLTIRYFGFNYNRTSSHTCDN